MTHDQGITWLREYITEPISVMQIGAGIPLLAASFITRASMRLMSLILATTAALIGFGSLGAWLGGASMLKGGARVVVGGWIALAITYGIGRAFGANYHV